MATAVAGALDDDDFEDQKPTESLFNGSGSNASLPGLLLALMTLFDTGAYTVFKPAPTSAFALSLS